MNKQLDFLDILSIASFVIGLENLQENITQGDMQELEHYITDEIHNHLEIQDRKLDLILERLKENDS